MKNFIIIGILLIVIFFFWDSTHPHTKHSGHDLVLYCFVAFVALCVIYRINGRRKSKRNEEEGEDFRGHEQ